MRLTLFALLSLVVVLPCVGQMQASPSGSSSVSLQRRDPSYKIGVDDSLTVNFALSPELNQIVLVHPDGFISLQNAHPVYVLGLTVSEAVAAIKVAYEGVLHDPLIEVGLTDYQKPLFTVLGQVLHPGQYELRRDLTLMEGLAVSGGVAPTAKTQIFLMRRVNGGSMLEAHKFNLKEVLNGKNLNEQPHLQAGDILVIPEKFITNFKKYVPYPGIGLNPLANNNF